MRVWITRSRPGADRHATALGEVGYETLVAPVIDIEPVAADASAVAGADALVVLSEHAVRCGGALLAGVQAPVIAIGAATAAALAEAGIAAQTPRVATSEGLLAMPALERVRGRRVVVLCGADGRDLLATALADRGAEVAVVPVYRRVPATPDLTPETAAGVDAIAVGSGDGFRSAARVWLHAGGRPDVPVLAPTARVAALGAELGLPNVRVCDGADSDALIGGLAALWPRAGDAMAQNSDEDSDSRAGAGRKTGADDAPGAAPGTAPAAEPAAAPGAGPETASGTAAREPETQPSDGPGSRAGSDAEPAASEPAASEPATSDPAAPKATPAPRESAPGTSRGGSGSDGDVAAPAGKPKGRALGMLALLLALGAAAGAGYVYYRLLYLDPLAGVADRLGVLERQLPTVAVAVEQLGERYAADVAALAETQEASLAESRRAMAAAVNEVTNRAEPAPREWRLAEVEYLLRIANHRLLMERDVASALQLLRVADGILAELDDFGLFPVRAALADELLALASVRGNDVQGIYLRLEAVKGRLEGLPLDVPRYLVDAAEDEPAEPVTVWRALAQRLSSYLTVRRFDGATRPLLAPEEAVYLELNLRLMLERAQLATLRREQIVYEESLGAARDWLLEYLDPDDATVQQLAGELDALLEVQLEQTLPDISGSLAALREAQRNAE